MCLCCVFDVRSTNFHIFLFKSLPTLINSTEAEDTEAAEEDTEAEEDTIKEATVEEEAIMTDRAVEADTVEEEIVTKVEDTKLYEGGAGRVSRETKFPKT
eukprot:scaffold1041_cov93-Skeletonema_dohrnii-CCMP3373.AAC.3